MDFEINTEAVQETLKNDGATFLKDIVSFLEVLLSYIKQLMGTIIVRPIYAKPAEDTSEG